MGSFQVTAYFDVLQKVKSYKLLIFWILKKRKGLDL